MYKSVCILALSLLLAPATAAAQGIDEADAAYRRFVTVTDAGADKATLYDALYAACTANQSVLRTSSPATDIYARAAANLRTLLPYLPNAAAYMSNAGHKANALLFACAYVDLSLQPDMASVATPSSATFARLAYYASAALVNTRRYAEAIPYLQAYVQNGEETYRRTVMTHLIKACGQTHNREAGLQTVRQAVAAYPRDFALLSAAVNFCIDTGDNALLATCVEQALGVKPDDETLLNIQGKLYEDNRDYDRSLAVYTRLQQTHPNAVDVAKHMAIGHYNLGVEAYNRVLHETSRSAQKQLRAEYVRCFTQAARQLERVVQADPASVKYTQALAVAYQCMGNTERFEAYNAKLASMGGGRIAPDHVPTPITYASTGTLMAATTPAPSYSPSTPAIGQTAAPAAAAPSSAPAAPSSDVDTAIPVTGINNSRTFAVVIANEHYSSVADVPMAANDGAVFATYCERTLGLPADNVRRYTDASYGTMLRAVRDIRDIASAFGGDIRILFYYAGHGIPDEATRNAYLLPVDADGRQTEGCYPLSRLYAELAATRASSVVVFLDACFSGAQREGDMLASARGVALKPKGTRPEGNVVVFSAATGDETAFPFTQQRHGLFTYFLLKKLQQTRGEVTLGELSDYVTENVKRQSVVTNRKVQTPTVTAAADATGWQDKKLR